MVTGSFWVIYYPVTTLKLLQWAKVWLYFGHLWPTWGVLGHSRPTFGVLGRCMAFLEHFLTYLGCFGVICDLYLWSFVVICDLPGVFWCHLWPTWGFFGVICDLPGVFWCHLWPTCGVLGRCMAVLGRFCCRDISWASCCLFSTSNSVIFSSWSFTWKQASVQTLSFFPNWSDWKECQELIAWKQFNNIFKNTPGAIKLRWAHFWPKSHFYTIYSIQKSETSIKSELV